MRSLTSSVRAAFGGTRRPESGELSFERPGSNLDEKRDVKGAAEDSAIRDPDGLTFDEATRGGLGRHLGFWSTYFLV